MESYEKNIGLVGCGYWGRNLFRVLNELGALGMVCDENPDTLSELNRTARELNYTTSFNELANNPSIKAIVIATPASSHYTLTMEALNAGKDVFVEKPLALSVEEGEELITLAKNLDKILMVGHILQYHPAVTKLKQLISDGFLGKINYIYSNRLNIGKLRTEENILWSFAPHDISAILMLVGEEPLKSSCFGGDYLNKGIYDITLTTLEFRGGIKGHIFVSWLHPYKEQKLIIVGSEAMVVFDDLTKEKLFLFQHKIEWKDGKIPIAHKADFQVIGVANDEPLKLELEHFLQCIKERTTPKTDGKEGLQVLRVISACEKELLKQKG